MTDFGPRSVPTRFPGRFLVRKQVLQIELLQGQVTEIGMKTTCAARNALPHPCALPGGLGVQPSLRTARKSVSKKGALEGTQD